MRPQNLFSILGRTAGFKITGTYVKNVIRVLFVLFQMKKAEWLKNVQYTEDQAFILDVS